MISPNPEVICLDGVFHAEAGGQAEVDGADDQGDYRVDLEANYQHDRGEDRHGRVNQDSDV